MTQASIKKATSSKRAESAPSKPRRATSVPALSVSEARQMAVESRKQENLLVRFDSSGKALLRRAAAARGLNVSDYVRARILPLARQDVEEAESGVLRLSREDQIVFWQALQNPPPPTDAQRRLGELIRSVM